MEIRTFTFNPFQENTFLLVKGSSAVVVDPGMSNAEERAYFQETLLAEELTLEAVWLTHAHIDHILGCDWVKRHYNVSISMFPEDHKTLQLAEISAKMYGIPYDPCPEPDVDIELGMMTWAGDEWEVRWVPGHAPGHVVFIHHKSGQVLGGDVLFRESIGRTDLPGGDHDTLLKCIKEQIYTLPDHYEVFPGHGPSTTVGHEKANNPFVRGE